MGKIKKILQTQIPSRDHGQASKGSKNIDTLQNAAITPSKMIREKEEVIDDFYKEENLLGKESKDFPQKPRPGQIKHQLKLSSDFDENSVARSGRASIKKSTMEKNHMHVNLEPMRAQIMSYLSLLKKMTINRP